jgi:hypothetical protein
VGTSKVDVLISPVNINNMGKGYFRSVLSQSLHNDVTTYSGYDIIQNCYFIFLYVLGKTPYEHNVNTIGVSAIKRASHILFEVVNLRGVFQTCLVLSHCSLSTPEFLSVPLKLKAFHNIARRQIFASVRIRAFITREVNLKTHLQKNQSF